MSAAKTVVLGAGPTGLSAALHLGPDAVLVEREQRVGGWCRSIRSGGFTFDMAGHTMFSNEPYVHGLYRLLLGDNVHWQEREAWIYGKGVHTRYPFQGALDGLPLRVTQERMMEAVANGNGNGAVASEASHENGHGLEADGSLVSNWMKRSTNGRGSHETVNGHAGGTGDGVGACVADRIQVCRADGFLVSEARPGEARPEVGRRREPRNFEEFIYQVWGAGFAEQFAIPYHRKLWAVPLSEMETSWLGARGPLPDVEERIEGALSPVPKPAGPNTRFGYPLRGGFQALMDGFLPHLRCELRLGVGARAVSPSRRTVTFDDGTTLAYQALVSTMPLPALIRSMGGEAPPAIREAAEGLRHVSVRCVNLGIGRPSLTEKHWIYYPEDTIFHRIFVQGNASPYCNAPGGFGLTCEITYSEHKLLPGDDTLAQRCVDDCRKVGILGAGDPIWTACQTDLPCAYVVPDHGRKARVDQIREWLLERDIVLAGRYSEWESYNSDHAFVAGREAAERVRELRAARSGGSSAERALREALAAARP